MSSDIVINEMTPNDWPAVRAIFAEGIATGNATFETTPPEWNAWNDGHLAHTRLVARIIDQIVGWVALAPVSRRACYAGVAEVSYYVGITYHGRGVGRRLLQTAVDSAEKHGIWTLTAGLFPENIASVRLLESCGFRQMGRRERIGRMNGVWRDTVIYERRSSVVGNG